MCLHRQYCQIHRFLQWNSQWPLFAPLAMHWGEPRLPTGLPIHKKQFNLMTAKKMQILCAMSCRNHTLSASACNVNTPKCSLSQRVSVHMIFSETPQPPLLPAAAFSRCCYRCCWSTGDFQYAVEGAWNFMRPGLKTPHASDITVMPRISLLPI